MRRWGIAGGVDRVCVSIPENLEVAIWGIDGMLFRDGGILYDDGLRRSRILLEVRSREGLRGDERY